MDNRTDEQLYEALVAINTVLQFVTELERDPRAIWSNGEPKDDDYPMKVAIHNEFGDVELSLKIHSPEKYTVGSYNEERTFNDSSEAIKDFKEKYQKL